MADKATTLPRSRKTNKAALTPSPLPRKSVKSLLPSLPKHKRSTVSVSSGQSTAGSEADTASLKDSSDARSVSSVGAASTPSVGNPSSSPLVPKAEKISIAPPKQTSKIRRSIVKGGKLLMPKFRHKNESAPILVETAVDLHRTNRTDDELLTRDQQAVAEDGAGAGEAADGAAEVALQEPAITKDDWSVKGTCERVKTMYEQGTRDSVYQEMSEEVEEPDAAPAVVVGSPNNGTGSGPEPDSLSEASNQSSPSTPSLTPKSEKAQLSFSKKSPTTLKKEIMNITNRKVSEGNQYIAAKLERKISLQARQPASKNDLLFKILVIGDLGTGKTSIIKRYVHQFFSQHYRATIGVDFAMKVLSWDDNTMIRLQLWDIAGQERFGNMTRVYYKEAVGAFIVFDVTRTSTYDAVLKWKQDLDSKVQLPDGQGIPCVLLANKCDQPKEGTVNSHSKMDEFCKQNKFISWFETSAKENINIDDAAHSLVSAILSNEAKKEQEGEQPNLNGSVGVVSINPDVTPDNRSSAQKSCNFC